MYKDSRMSKFIYVELCYELGTPTVVKIRREVMDTEHLIYRPVMLLRVFDRMFIGSQREGFRMDTSDLDWLFWLPDHKVLNDLSQNRFYRTPQHTLILMECENVPPGYCKLKLMTPSNNDHVNQSCITINGAKYISSTLYRTNCLTIVKSLKGNPSHHGPCASFPDDICDVDFAYGFMSHHWPAEAFPWIRRCLIKKWPEENVLSSITKKGCHVVPVGSISPNPITDTEWRISYSVAELMLVNSLNHCQFLCYGLLKIFLREVINSESYLCSYFMKTVLFWVIQTSNLKWTPSNFLECFWTCFKSLIFCVYKCECPHFIVPQNNMFRVKGVGHAQVALFDQLYNLYCMGISCLLKRLTVGKHHDNFFRTTLLSFRTNESSVITDAELDVCLFKEVYETGNIPIQSKEEFVSLISVIENLQITRLTSFQKVMVQKCFSSALRNFSWLMLSQNMTALHVSNKRRAYINKIAHNMIKLASRLGFASDFVHLAIYYYNQCQYKKSLKCLQIAKKRGLAPYAIYDREFSDELYSSATAGMSLGDKMRKVVIVDIYLHSFCYYFEELFLEQYSNFQDGMHGVLCVPFFVMLHMLFVLNHHKLGDKLKARQYVRDLNIMLQQDDRHLVPSDFKDISWQILGICQQTCGDFQRAYNSYQRSLVQDPPMFRIRRAAILRMKQIESKLI